MANIAGGGGGVLQPRAITIHLVQARQRPRMKAPTPRSAQAGAPSGRDVQNPISWGGRVFASPQAVVDWMNARGAGTSVDQFLGNHPGVAAAYGQRQAAPAPPAPSIGNADPIAALLAHASPGGQGIDLPPAGLLPSPSPLLRRLLQAAMMGRATRSAGRAATPARHPR